MTDMNNQNKPANLGRYSEFIQVPKSYLKLRKKHRSINVIAIVATDNMSPEAYDKAISIHNRLNKVTEVLKGRNLKFIKQWFAHDAISKALDDLEQELGIEKAQ